MKSSIKFIASRYQGWYPVLMLLFLLGTLASCQEKVLGPVGADDETPGPVANVQVEPGPGTVHISYSLPDAKNLLYVKALVTIRSEEHTSELQSLMRISYAVFCLTKNNTQTTLTKYK